MKRLTFFLLFAVLLAIAAGAPAAQVSPETAARNAVPPDTELLRTRTDDGLLVYAFKTADDMRYEVEIDPSGLRVVHVDIDAADQRGGAGVVLSAQEAEAVLLSAYPEANIYFVHQERDDGRFHYELYFNVDSFLGHAEVNAENGALMDVELDYSPAAQVQTQGALSAEAAKELALSLVADGRITEFEKEREDGRTVYEGEIRTESVSYDFMIDAETGRFLEWERDE